MGSTRITRRINAPRQRVYRAFLDAGDAARWKAPTRGRFVELVPPERIVEVVELESDDPAMRGETTVTISLAEVDGKTELVAVHDRLPPGLSPADNETVWRISLGKLAELVEAEELDRLRDENQRLRAEVERLHAELQRLGRYLAAPPGSEASRDQEAEIGWGYQRGDLDDDLGDD